MKVKRWIAALLAGALMLCGLPAYAETSWMVPKQAQKLRYTFGERGFIEQDEQKIQQVLKTLQQVQPKETKLEQGKDGNTKSELILTERDQTEYRYQFNSSSWGKKVRNNYRFWSADDRLMTLEQQLQKRMQEIDPYGRFTWAEEYVCICLLDNGSRYAVFEELPENKNLLLERLQNLNVIKGSDEAALGNRLSGVSEMRIRVVKVPHSDSTTWSYQLYEKGIKVVSYTTNGKGAEEIYLCPNENLWALKAQMQKTYDATPEKSATWLAIINPDRVTSLTVVRSGEQPVSLTNLAQIEMLDLLCSLPVEQAEKKTALWKTPDTEYRITFANGLLYRVQQLKNKLRLWSSDMDFLLEYTLSKENQERLNERTQFEILRQQAGKTNPETGEPVIQQDEKPNPDTAKPVIYLYPQQTQKVRVQLDFDGKLTSTYPTYPQDGWTVTAQPDGTLTDEQGRSYRYLFWEGVADDAWRLENGSFVKAEDARAFLEQSLSRLGLNELEQNDFISYWLPKLQANEESFVHFAAEQYTDRARLTVSPQPDSVLRVQMLMIGVDSSNRRQLSALPKQQLQVFARKGFTLVEWGGTDLTGFDVKIG